MSRTCTALSPPERTRRPSCRRLSGPPLVVLLLALSPVPAGATLLRPLSVEVLADLSDVVVRGRVGAVEVVWNDSATMPITRVELEILETLEGDAGGRRLILTVPGGERDGLALEYSGRPRFSVGEEVVLFLQRRGARAFIPVGLAQGRLEVHRDAATGRARLARDLAGAVLIGTEDSELFVPGDLDTLRSRLRARPRRPDPARP